MIVTSMPTVTILQGPTRARANQHISETGNTAQVSAVSFTPVISAMMVLTNKLNSPVLALDFLVQLLHSTDETIIGNTALCLGHCADMGKGILLYK